MAFLNHVPIQNSSEVDFEAKKPNFSENQRLNLLFFLREMLSYDCNEPETEASVCKAVKELFDGFPFQEVDCAKYLMTDHIPKEEKLAKCWVIEIEQAKPSVIKFFYRDGHRQLITSIKAKVKLPVADNQSLSYSQCIPQNISNTYEEVALPNDDKQNNSKSKISNEAEKLPVFDNQAPFYSEWVLQNIPRTYEEVDLPNDDNQVNSKPQKRIEVDDSLNPNYSPCTIVTSKDSVPIKVDKKGSGEVDNKDSESKPYDPNRPEYILVTNFKPKPSK